jgi:hypothetical protein
VVVREDVEAVVAAIRGWRSALLAGATLRGNASN